MRCLWHLSSSATWPNLVAIFGRPYSFGGPREQRARAPTKTHTYPTDGTGGTSACVTHTPTRRTASHTNTMPERHKNTVCHRIAFSPPGRRDRALRLVRVVSSRPSRGEQQAALGSQRSTCLGSNIVPPSPFAERPPNPSSPLPYHAAHTPSTHPATRVSTALLLPCTAVHACLATWQWAARYTSCPRSRAAATS